MFDYFSNVLQRFWLYHWIALMCWPKRINFSTEAHIHGEIISAFVFLLTAIARAPALTFIGTTVSGKYHKILTTLPWFPSCTDACISELTLVARLWALYYFCPFLATIARFEQHGHHLSCTLIWMKCRLATYVIWAALEQGLNAVCPGIYKVGVRLSTGGVVATWTIYICNDRNNLFHTFLTMTCPLPSHYYNYVTASQYVILFQYIRCNYWYRKTQMLL